MVICVSKYSKGGVIIDSHFCFVCVTSFWFGWVHASSGIICVKWFPFSGFLFFVLRCPCMIYRFVEFVACRLQHSRNAHANETMQQM